MHNQKMEYDVVKSSEFNINYRTEMVQGGYIELDESTLEKLLFLVRANSQNSAYISMDLGELNLMTSTVAETPVEEPDISISIADLLCAEERAKKFLQTEKEHLADLVKTWIAKNKKL